MLIAWIGIKVELADCKERVLQSTCAEGLRTDGQIPQDCTPQLQKGSEPKAASKWLMATSPTNTAQDNDLEQVQGNCRLCSSDIARLSVDTSQQEECAAPVQQQTVAELAYRAKVVAN